MKKYRSLEILTELSENNTLTQRDLSKRLNIAVGLVNSYIKNLVTKGYVKVTSMPPRRYAYLLTPKGFAEKSRLTYNLLKDYTRIYSEARNNLKGLFAELKAEGIKRVAFAGADEVTEIAYISIQETDIELAGVVDDEKAGNDFFGREIMPLGAVAGMSCDCVVITSYYRREQIQEELSRHGVAPEKIRGIF